MPCEGGGAARALASPLALFGVSPLPLRLFGVSVTWPFDLALLGVVAGVSALPLPLPTLRPVRRSLSASIPLLNLRLTDIGYRRRSRVERV
jgi:hypothetical protein